MTPPLHDTCLQVWSSNGVEGVHRFLGRVWRLGTERLGPRDGPPPERAQRVVLARTVAKVTEETEALRFNTAIAAMMEAVNAMTKWKTCPPELFEQLVLLLAPYAPHICEELWQVGCLTLDCLRSMNVIKIMIWRTTVLPLLTSKHALFLQRLGHNSSLAYASWPEHHPDLLKDDVVSLPIQVNGKVRAVIQMTRGADEAEVLERAVASEPVQRHLQDKEIKKKVYVPDRILNLIVK